MVKKKTHAYDNELAALELKLSWTENCTHSDSLCLKSYKAKLYLHLDKWALESG